MFSGRCSPELLSLGADTLIIQTIMDLIESDWAEMSHGQLKFVEIWRDRCCDNNGRGQQHQTLVIFTLKILYTIDKNLKNYLELFVHSLFVGNSF